MGWFNDTMARVVPGLTDRVLAAAEMAQTVTLAAASPAPMVTIPGSDGPLVCQPQAAQAFLVRSNWFSGSSKDRVSKMVAANDYRTKQYGYVKGFGNPKLNPLSPGKYAKTTSFMGMSVTVNERIIPALRCVEADLKVSGVALEYSPKLSEGIRYKNSFSGGRGV